MSGPTVALNKPLLMSEGEAVPHSAPRSKNKQALLALFIGFGLGCAIIHGNGWQNPASAISLAASYMQSTNAFQRLTSATRAWQPMQSRSWQPMQPAPQPMQPTMGLPGQPMPPRVIMPVSAQQQGKRTVMAQAEMKTITILGATGLVGQELLRLIPRAWPGAKLNLFASSDKSFEVDGKTYECKAASLLETPDAPKGDVAFVALDDAFSKKYVPILLELGYKVVDKSNTYRMDPNVPLVVPGVNSDLVTDDVKLVANPNCNTIPFCLAVAPIQRKFGLKGATVSSYQAVSGAGIGTLDDFLSKCNTGYSEPNRIGTQFDAKGYAGNVVPHNGGTDDSGFSSEERKLIFESRKILRLPDFDVSAQCCRVPVAVGHYENAWVTFNEKVTPDTAQSILTDPAQSPFVVYKEGPVGEDISSLTSVANRDKSVVGRVRPDPRDDSQSTLCMTVAGDNLRLGAATNAVRVASCWFPSKDEDLQAKCFPPAK